MLANTWSASKYLFIWEHSQGILSLTSVCRGSLWSLISFSVVLPFILQILKVCEIKFQRGVMSAWRTRSGLGPRGSLLDARSFTSNFVEDFWTNFCALWDLLARAKGNRKASCCCWATRWRWLCCKVGRAPLNIKPPGMERWWSLGLGILCLREWEFLTGRTSENSRRWGWERSITEGWKGSNMQHVFSSTLHLFICLKPGLTCWYCAEPF